MKSRADIWRMGNGVFSPAAAGPILLKRRKQHSTGDGMKRRDLLKSACALPFLPFVRSFEALAQPARDAARITAIKALQIKNAQTLIRIDTDRSEEHTSELQSH